jgi:hypothetical protein
MAALLMGKALVAKNPKVQNNLWKQDVIKPFPSRFVKSSGLNASSFEVTASLTNDLRVWPK